MGILAVSMISCDNSDAKLLNQEEENSFAMVMPEEISSIVGENFHLLLMISKDEIENKKSSDEINTDLILAKFDAACSVKQRIVANREWCKPVSRDGVKTSWVDIMPDTLKKICMKGL